MRWAAAARVSAVLWTASCVWAAPAGWDVYILGEVHDNPAHHAHQADLTAQIAPRALVFEMLTAEQALRLTPQNRTNEDTLARLLDWQASGWPDFSYYFPIFEAAPDAAIYGGAFTGDLRGVVRENRPPESVLTQLFALDAALPPHEQAAREAFQDGSHCFAMPKHLLPGMVLAQRVRDAGLAYRTLAALDDTQGPVVLVTGNGHARTDWGVPALLRHARPELRVWSLGQSEDGRISGPFDAVRDAAAPEREDPCAAFE